MPVFEQLQPAKLVAYVYLVYRTQAIETSTISSVSLRLPYDIGKIIMMLPVHYLFTFLLLIGF